MRFQSLALDRLSVVISPLVLLTAGLAGMLILGPAVQAEGTLELRGFSISGSQTLLDAFSIRGHYQMIGDAGSSYGGDFSADTSLQSISARYSSGQHAVQGQFQRKVASDINSSASGTFSYSYAPVQQGSGAAFTSVSTFYSYSGSSSASQSVSVNVLGASTSARLAEHVNTTLNATATRVNVEAGTFSSQQTGGSLSGSVSYAQDSTSVSLSPNVSLQNGDVSWSAGLNGSTKPGPQVTLTGSAYLTPTSPISGTIDAGYDASPLFGTDTPAGRLTVGATASLSNQQVSFGARAASVISAALSVGTNVAYTPATSALTVGGNASGRVGGLALSLNSSVVTAPDVDPAFSVSGSVSGQTAPWYGSLYGSYRRQGNTQGANVGGTFGYRLAPLDVGVTLALSAYPQLSGTAEATAAYTVTEHFDVSGSARYERTSGADATTRLRYGIGLRYRF